MATHHCSACGAPLVRESLRCAACGAPQRPAAPRITRPLSTDGSREIYQAEGQPWRGDPHLLQAQAQVPRQSGRVSQHQTSRGGRDGTAPGHWKATLSLVLIGFASALMIAVPFLLSEPQMALVRLLILPAILGLWCISRHLARHADKEALAEITRQQAEISLIIGNAVISLMLPLVICVLCSL
jgi:hypothetical protein